MSYKNIHSLILFLFYLVLASSVSAVVSTNVPLGNWSYDDIDRLIGMGLINSALSNTRPFTRLEMARLIKEAINHSERKGTTNKITASIMARLKRKFKEELIYLKVFEGYTPATYFKPLNTVFFRYYHSREDALIENQEGERAYGGSNYRGAFSLRGKLWDHLGVFIQPEFEMQRDEGDWLGESELRQIYGKIEFYNLEIEVGRDSLWWGPGRHGTLFLTNNSKPYEYLVKISNPQPVLLPWILGYLGPLQATMFWAELEEDRFVSKAKLLGQRINFKPIPSFQLGFTRTYNWGGKNKDERLHNFIEAFLSKGGSDQDSYNYLAGMDASLRIPEIDRLIPLAESITLYFELGSDDEKDGFLNENHMAYVMGAYFGDLFLSGRTNLRIEYSTNHPRFHAFWYLHDRYRSGYTYKGRVIGHHMGTDSDDMFIQMTHYITSNWLLELSYDRERKSWVRNSPVEGDDQTKHQWDGALTFLGVAGMRIRGIYRYEKTNNHLFKTGDLLENHIGGMDVIHSF